MKTGFKGLEVGVVESVDPNELYGIPSVYKEYDREINIDGKL